MNNKIALRYVRKKKRKKRVAIISSIASIGLAIILIIAFNLFYVDRFTISISESDTLCLTINKESFTTKLNAPPLLKATDTQYSDIPEDIDDGLGSKNTNYYFAYSFYLGCKNIESSINYELSMTLEKVNKNLEEAMRVMIIKNGVKSIYSKGGKYIYDGETHESEPQIIGSTIPFKENKHIILEPYKINGGDFDKYTIVMWIDGWESVNAMKGGIFQSNIKFSTISING